MKSCCEPNPKLNDISAMKQLLGRVVKAMPQTLDLGQALGRVLAQDVIATRDSPACDVSAMDGYAVKISELPTAGQIRVCGELAIGQKPEAREPLQVMKIFTGGPAPAWVDAVVKREDTLEGDGVMSLKMTPEQIIKGQHIRRQGENVKAQEKILSKGQRIDSAAAGVLATFGYDQVLVYAKLKIGILTTGNELKKVNQKTSDWEIRDSNAYAIKAMFANTQWATVLIHQHAIDDLEHTQQCLKHLLETVDVLLVTGGVSMGDHDHVPRAIQNIGGEIIFHKLNIRPGKPLLGAVAAEGKKIIMGLPGNPVSAMVTARRFAVEAMRKMAGFLDHEICDAMVELLPCAQDKKLNLHSFRPAKIQPSGQAKIIKTQGSGDLIAVANSDGFVYIPAGEMPAGIRAFYRWSL